MQHICCVLELHDGQEARCPLRRCEELRYSNSYSKVAFELERQRDKRSPVHHWITRSGNDHLLWLTVASERVSNDRFFFHGGHNFASTYVSTCINTRLHTLQLLNMLRQVTHTEPEGHSLHDTCCCIYLLWQRNLASFSLPQSYTILSSYHCPYLWPLSQATLDPMIPPPPSRVICFNLM